MLIITVDKKLTLYTNLQFCYGCQCILLVQCDLIKLDKVLLRIA